MSSRKREIKSPRFNLDASVAPIELSKPVENRLIEAGVVWKRENPHYFTAYVDGITMHIEKVMSTAADRGEWKVLVESHNWKHSVDQADCFPRYYFRWDFMILEIEEWMRRRALKQRESEKLKPPVIRVKQEPLEV